MLLVLTASNAAIMEWARVVSVLRTTTRSVQTSLASIFRSLSSAVGQTFAGSIISAFASAGMPTMVVTIVVKAAAKYIEQLRIVAPPFATCLSMPEAARLG